MPRRLMAVSFMAEFLKAPVLRLLMARIEACQAISQHPITRQLWVPLGAGVGSMVVHPEMNPRDTRDWREVPDLVLTIDYFLPDPHVEWGLCAPHAVRGEEEVGAIIHRFIHANAHPLLLEVEE